MSNDLQIQALLTACMADLGRERQEELPLNSDARRPTFMPGRAGTNHISQKLKEKLAGGWGAKIDDGEVRQMEGLECEDARPWAKSAGCQPPFQGPVSKQMNHGSTSIQKSQKKPQPAVKPGNPRHIYVQQPKKPGPLAKPKPTPVQSRRLAKEPTGTPFKGPNLNLEVKKPAPEIKSEEQTLCRGKCVVLPDDGKMDAFTVEVCLNANLKTSRGTLVLTPPTGRPRVHDVLDLDPPTVKGTTCTTVCPGSNGVYTYNLKFQTSSEAQDFQHYLDILQQSAAQNLKESSAMTEDVPSPANSEETLLELDDSPSICGEGLIQRILVESFAKLLHETIRDVMNTLADYGVPISEQDKQTVEDILIQHFDKLGMTDHRSSDNQADDEFKYLLRTAVKRKQVRDAEEKESIVRQSPAVKALRDVEFPTGTQHVPTKYTPAEILGLRCGANQQGEIQPEAQPTAQPGNSEMDKTPDPSPAADAAVATKKPQEQPKGLASSRWATSPSKRVEDSPVSAKPSPQEAPVADPSEMDRAGCEEVQGLSSSMWAVKPIAS